MSTTVGTLEKKVETVFENLTPEEKAEYIYDETWRVADEQAKGIDEEAHQQNIERFFHRHVATLSASGYIQFLIAEDKLNTSKWAGIHFTNTMMAYDREDCLLHLLILDAELLEFLIHEKTKKPGQSKTKKIAVNPDWARMIEGYKSRRAAILKDAKQIWKDDLWERWNIPRPELSPDFIEAITEETKGPEHTEQAGQ